ncbi:MULTISPECIES: 16S rRNA (cytidine(1402)-2'-O)-methyltransferase [Phyllobacteriaceae]|jgi:16S rRNA (cytidine1402-2'-O)-methyltransferase|uniref:Ribosomal RNA small subunit methyltransferase I n=1 Tax=Mesorhizobium hungaricum TaxID=1566387 RepID=A0A1C2DK28_9HYPH|nr:MULTISPECIES: 16S rRNA (cytidine(1402)-2'-O)-methyltransferase [Mesorhizobium]MBN9233463.1 16S rRNA (cytidine(1402)-2'-O)-methyltransferase [Mesorhizobium sp.]MDQ0331847.1 16S rRNA (cytidine1402-2'-O)-methyltransferase [Mesorhizobium sp. YL-MeA3-2017]OCX15036.1 16S rRNA (cytidine(1402)-2'-O)-methyltransferase [Mesorhizobium hungaricum]
MSADAAKRTYVIGQTEIAVRPLQPALYLVATPIGNLADITLRALETLAAADLVACEDTRVSRVLLERYGIRRRTTAYHEHNAAEAGPKLIAALEGGQSVALISDAGTPLVSDPGYRLVGEAIERGIRVVPIPGPSAPLAALTASGLPSDTFLFAGFLPSKAGQRQTRLEELLAVPATLIFFESPRRLAETLGAMAKVLGAARPAAIGRELTKTFEEMRPGTLGALAAHYAEADTPKGEIVICVGPPLQRTEGPADIDRLLLSLSAEMPTSKAAAEAAKMTGGQKQALYRRLLELKDAGGG